MPASEEVFDVSESTKAARTESNGRQDSKPRKDAKGGKGTLKHKGGEPAKKEQEISARVSTVTSVVYRAAGVQVVKSSRVSYPGATVSDVSYAVEFDGHEAIPFTRMGEAVERAKAGPPAPPAAVEAEAPEGGEQE